MTVIEADHVCSPPENPRYKHTCVRCGRPIPQVFRDRRFEDEATYRVCDGLKVDVNALNVFASRRADHAKSAYGFDFPDLSRNLEREACEELADARNYLVWRLDALNRGYDEDHWKVPHLQTALRHVALAFEELRAAGG